MQQGCDFQLPNQTESAWSGVKTTYNTSDMGTGGDGRKSTRKGLKKSVLFRAGEVVFMGRQSGDHTVR